MIRFKQVTKVYETDSKQVTAVDQINLDVDKGHICVFLGPSGCGKTSLLRMVNRLISITDGTIEVGGKNIEASTVTDLRRNIGYVIQQVGLFPNMTIEDNISVVPKLLGWDRVKMRKRYNELMELMGLNPEEYCKRYPWELSGGQQQRIGVARALAADPPVMLMDEPFGALDPIIREHIQNEFLRIQGNVKKTILFVSHDIDEAIKLGDTVAIFKAGKLMQHGTPDEILSQPNSDFVRDFVGVDRSLKRLSLLNVKDLLKKKKPLKQPLSDHQDLQDYVVQLETNLRTALSIVLSSPNGQVQVVDGQSNSMGILSIQDFDILGELHPEQMRSVVS
jgi:osmoprotectant transport system ATP-binding protein